MAKPRKSRKTKAATGVAITGGCLCRACRYRATGTPLWVGHCHCTMCQRASGSAFLTWVALTTEGFEFTGPHEFYRSSADVARSFCQNCGSPLTFSYLHRPDRVFVTAGTLDSADHIAPVEHIFWETHADWVNVDDHLPRRLDDVGS